MTDREFAFDFLPAILIMERGKIKKNIGFLTKKDIEETLAERKETYDCSRLEVSSDFRLGVYYTFFKFPVSDATADSFYCAIAVKLIATRTLVKYFIQEKKLHVKDALGDIIFLYWMRDIPYLSSSGSIWRKSRERQCYETATAALWQAVKQIEYQTNYPVGCVAGWKGGICDIQKEEQKIPVPIAAIAYWAKVQQMAGKKLKLSPAMLYHVPESCYEAMPELARMMHVHRLIVRFWLLEKQYRGSVSLESRKTQFVSLLTCLGHNSEYLPFYLLPIADIWDNTYSDDDPIGLTYDIARRLTDNKSLFQDTVLAVAVASWAKKKKGNLISYLERMTNMPVADIRKSGSRIVKALELGCRIRCEDERLIYRYAYIGNEVCKAIPNTPDAGIYVALAATIAEANTYHETEQKHSITENNLAYDTYRYPVKETAEYCMPDGKVIKGEKMVTGYWGWQVQGHRFLALLPGNKDKPFDEEVKYWMWFKENWSLETVCHMIDAFMENSGKRRKYKKDKVFLHWEGKFLNLLAGHDWIIVSFKDFKFEVIDILPPEKGMKYPHFANSLVGQSLPVRRHPCEAYGQAAPSQHWLIEDIQ